MNLFVIVSTGQKVANLPPVLELAQPKDEVVWIESQEAHQRGWTSAPQKILKRSGLRTRKVVPVAYINDPWQLAQTLKPVAEACQGVYERVYLVTNGGTKHTPLGLYWGFSCLSPWLLYGEERPAAYSLLQPDREGQTQLAPYTRHHFDLPDILTVNGYGFALGDPGLRIWPDTLPHEIASEPYGLDEAYTYRLHEQHAAWGRYKAYSKSRYKDYSPENENPSRSPPVRFEDLETLVPKAYATWLSNCYAWRYALNQQSLCNLYHSTLKLANQARLAMIQRAASQQPPQDMLGNALEAAVARRVHAWQERHRHTGVQSIWTGVKIAREQKPEIVEAEFDILIVLKNGVLFHLECKSAEVRIREMDANTRRLQQAGSQLARTVVVSPLYTQCASQAFFHDQCHNSLRLLEHFGPQGVLFFTMVNQPTEFTRNSEDGPMSMTCPAFEERLTELLKPYAL